MKSDLNDLAIFGGTPTCEKKLHVRRPNIGVPERLLGLGIGTMVKDGVRIGPGSLIGTGAVVLSNIPGGGVAHGMPARIKWELSRK